MVPLLFDIMTLKNTRTFEKLFILNHFGVGKCTQHTNPHSYEEWNEASIPGTISFDELIKQYKNETL